MEELKAFRISLKLKEGKSPHIYLTQLKEIMSHDTSLHPMMEKTLKLLKKTRTPFILLATIREVVIDSPNMRHFDRSVEPRGDWVCTLWSEVEIKQHRKAPEAHVKQILHLFEELGYELYNSLPCSLDYIKSLEDLTLPQIQSQMEQRQEMEYDKK